MSEFWSSAFIGTVQSIAAGGSALLLGWLASRQIVDVVRRHRVMGWTVRVAVLAFILAFLPGWWNLTVPAWVTSTAERALPAKPAEPLEANRPLPDEFEYVWVPFDPDDEPVTDREISTDNHPVLLTEAVDDEKGTVEKAGSTNSYDLLAEVAPIVLIPYWTCVVVIVLRQMIGLIGLYRIRRLATKAPAEIAELAHSLANGSVRPRILVSERLTTPICFGVICPTIVLPKWLIRSSSIDQIRWVLAHELDHLKRRDPSTGLWIGFAHAIYFVVPWFWTLRRQIQLTQEYLADAAAAGSQTTEYAAFLVELSSRPGVSRFVKAVPSLAGVRAGQSDLFRRVTMLLEPKNRSSRLGRVWSTLAICSAVSVAVTLSGVRIIADEPKKEKVKKPDEVQVEVRVLEKKPDGAKKPADVVKDVDVIIVRDNAKKTDAIEKAILEAAKKGDVEAVKKLVAELKAATAPQIARFKQGVIPPVPPAPPVPPVKPIVGRIEVAKDLPQIAKVRVLREVSDEETAKLQQAIEKLSNAIAEVKDKPEAKAALEQSLAEYKKKLAELHAKRAEFHADKAAIPGQFQFQVQGFDPAEMEKMKDQMAKAKNELEQKLQALKGKENAKEAMQEAMKNYEQAMKTLMEHQAKLPGQFQWIVKPDAEAMKKGLFWVQRDAAAGRGKLGIEIEPLSPVLVEQMNIPGGKGVVVVRVYEGTPAAKAGIKQNDIVLEVAGKKASVEDLPKILSGMTGEGQFDVVILRKGKRESIKGVSLPSPDKKDVKKESKSKSISVSIDNDRFEIKSTEGTLAIELEGTVNDQNSVQVRITNDKKKVYEGKGIKAVPSDYREQVQELLKSVSK